MPALAGSPDHGPLTQAQFLVAPVCSTAPGGRRKRELSEDGSGCRRGKIMILWMLLPQKERRALFSGLNRA